MSSAGFHYDPSQDELDRVSCASCSLVLEGWDHGDDPFQEHQSRRPSCPFVQYIKDQKSALKEIELIKYLPKDSNHSISLMERNMTVEEYIKSQQEKAKLEFLSESEKIISHLITQGNSIF